MAGATSEKQDRKPESRNLSAFHAGRSQEQIGADYQLGIARIRVILMDERNRRLFSIEQHYCDVRRQTNIFYGVDLAGLQA
jgi:hypothetical protein